MFLPVSAATVSAVFKDTESLCCFQGVSVHSQTPHARSHTGVFIVLLSLAPPAGYLQAVQASSVLACIFSIIGIFVFVAQLFTLAKGQRFTISGAFQFLACKYFFPTLPMLDCFLCQRFPLCKTSTDMYFYSTCPSLQACASWSQPPSTQTASTLKSKVWVIMATASSWRGSPSLSHSSPPSLTSCYARRLQSNSGQPQNLQLDLLFS